MSLDLPPHLHAVRMEGDDWRKITPVKLRDCVTGAAPRQATEVRVARTDDCLRVHFTCIDAKPWATLTERGAPLYEEEVVEVFLDPVGDLECYFEIEVNPLNAVLHLVLRKSPSGLKKNFAWRCEGLKTRVERQPDGWTAELAIPFESLMPGCGTFSPWRVNFLRIDRPRDAERELSAWSPTGFAQFHVPARFGFLQLEP